MRYTNSYKDLSVWQRGMELVEETYKISHELPRDEMYGLISQMRRAAVSIPLNIAEGKKRGTSKEFKQFLRTSDGSAAELETIFLLVAKLYPHVKTEKAQGYLIEVQRMLTSFLHKISGAERGSRSASSSRSSVPHPISPPL